MANGTQIKHIEIAITPPSIVRFFRYNLVEFSRVTVDKYILLRSKGHRQWSRSQRDVTYQQ